MDGLVGVHGTDGAWAVVDGVFEGEKDAAGSGSRDFLHMI